MANVEFNRAFVLMQYFGYLRRDPNSGQDTDYTGYDFWLTKLNQFNGNYIQAEMVKPVLPWISRLAEFGTIITESIPFQNVAAFAIPNRS